MKQLYLMYKGDVALADFLDVEAAIKDSGSYF